MHHHRDVEAVEGAAVEHQDLAPAAFLRGRAEDDHGRVDLVGDTREPDRRAHRARRDDVVPARVPDVGERVVLRAALLAGAHVHHDLAGFAGIERAKRIGGDVVEHLVVRVHPAATPSSAVRNLRRAVRMRVFTVPSGVFVRRANS